MRILHRYIAKDFLIGFTMTLLVFTFVMCAAVIMQAIDLMARGVSGGLILQLFLINIPYLLSFSIPISVMTSVLLLFSRLSFDGEITAMKACGLTLWQIAAPILLLSLALSGFCVYVNNVLAPRSHFAERQILHNLGVEDPLSLLDEGRFVRDFPGLMVYVGKKSRNKVEDIVVYEADEHGIERHVRASSGIITSLPEEDALLIDLYDVRIDQPDEKHPLDPSKTRTLTAKRYPVKLDLSEILKKGVVTKREKDMTFSELMDVIRYPERFFPQFSKEMLVNRRMKELVTINTRLAFSFSCLAFALLGIPLGMRSHRKESSVGIGISLLVVFAFYALMVLAGSMDSQPKLRPDLIVWLPLVGVQGLGILLINRMR